ncbi:stage V sporulation protein AA [Bacillus massiliigorillae]|uniref:stage V sporulation protein AA n=1 Tax=Bacillus massiliigorillae TaxID=1243664 RepID=UPI0003A6A544|nr:stage V sporulation protein AA [Bacillus massiliigorillae]
MDELVYVRMRNRVLVAGRSHIYVRDIAKLIGPQEITEHIRNLQIYEIKKSDRNIIIIDFIQVLEKVLEVYGQVEIQAVGPNQTIIEVKQKTRKLDSGLFVFVWLLLFVGAALTIMNFHEDVSMPIVHQKLYALMTGKHEAKPLILQIPYSIGLGVGMVLFFNHFFKKRFNEEPSPLEVEMFNYQQDLDRYVMIKENKESTTHLNDHSNH